MARFRYGRVYKAYFFERPIVRPVSVTVVARSFEQALELVRAQFPDRTISGFFAEDNHRLVPHYEAVIIAPNLPAREPPDLEVDPYSGAPKEVSRSWYREVGGEPEEPPAVQ